MPNKVKTFLIGFLFISCSSGFDNLLLNAIFLTNNEIFYSLKYCQTCSLCSSDRSLIPNSLASLAWFFFHSTNFSRSSLNFCRFSSSKRENSSKFLKVNLRFNGSDLKFSVCGIMSTFLGILAKISFKTS